MKFRELVFFSHLMVALVVAAPPQRISSRIVNLGEVTPVYLVAGMASVIELPGAVAGFTTGNMDDVQVFRPERPENEITVVLKSAQAQPTNLIVSVGKRKFVFDIVPSKTIHQDRVQITAAFGSPNREEVGAVLLDSSEAKAKP